MGQWRLELEIFAEKIDVGKQKSWSELQADPQVIG